MPGSLGVLDLTPNTAPPNEPIYESFTSAGTRTLLLACNQFLPQWTLFLPVIGLIPLAR